MLQLLMSCLSFGFITEGGNVHLGICAVGLNGEFTITSYRHRGEDNNNTTWIIITVQDDEDENNDNHSVTALDFEHSIPTANISDLNSQVVAPPLAATNTFRRSRVWQRGASLVAKE
jgi:hypothetical protein